MEVYMINMDEQRENLTQKLSQQYALNMINIEEYERLLEYVNRIETPKELSIVQGIIHENNANNSIVPITEQSEIVVPQDADRHMSVFSWRTSNVRPVNGNGGRYMSVFGTNQIIVDSLPPGRTVINVDSVFGLTEIIVPANIKITNKIAPIFAGVFSPANETGEDDALSELYLVGKAVFSNITIKTAGEHNAQVRKYNELTEKITDEIHQKIINKYKPKR
jgi:hypothetical protein